MHIAFVLSPFFPVNHLIFFSSTEFGVLFQKTLAAGAQGPDIWQRLEIVICDSKCSVFRPSVIALVLLCTQLQTGVEALGDQADPALCAQLVQLVSFAVCLQKISQVGLFLSKITHLYLFLLHFSLQVFLCTDFCCIIFHLS